MFDYLFDIGIYLVRSTGGGGGDSLVGSHAQARYVPSHLAAPIHSILDKGRQRRSAMVFDHLISAELSWGRIMAEEAIHRRFLRPGGFTSLARYIPFLRGLLIFPHLLTVDSESR